MSKQMEEDDWRLVVIETGSADSGCAFIHDDTMKELGIERGDVFLLKTDRGIIASFIAINSIEIKSGAVQVHSSVLSNLSLHVREHVMVKNNGLLKYATDIVIETSLDNDEALEILEPYFHEAYRPVSIGVRFSVNTGDEVFCVTSIQPYSQTLSCTVAPETRISILKNDEKHKIVQSYPKTKKQQSTAKNIPLQEYDPTPPKSSAPPLATP